MLSKAILLVMLAAVSFRQSPPEPSYQSHLLKGLSLSEVEGNYTIEDDEGKEVQVTALKDPEGILYWYRRVQTPVCLTGECKNVDIGIYWRCTGKFLGLEIYGENLTKTDHSEFTFIDYEQLLSVLNNEWSALREYELTELVDNPDPSVDGIVGATRQVIASEAVRNAVYTTYTIWHLANEGENEQLRLLTLRQLNKNGQLLEDLLGKEEREYDYFLLEGLGSGLLSASAPVNSLVMKSLRRGKDPYLKGLAFKSLAMLPLDTKEIQAGLPEIYKTAPAGEKLQVLSALKGVSFLGKPLYQVLAADLLSGNEWFAVKVLEAMENLPDPPDEVINAARKLSQSDNTAVRNKASGFLENSLSK